MTFPMPTLSFIKISRVSATILKDLLNYKDALGNRELAQQLRTLALLVEDSSAVLSIT